MIVFQLINSGYLEKDVFLGGSSQGRPNKVLPTRLSGEHAKFYLRRDARAISN